MDIVQSCWQQETPKPQGSLKPWRGNTQTYPVPSYGIQLQGHHQREDQFGEATIVAKQQLELQSTSGSSPIISKHRPNPAIAAASLYLLSVTAGSCPEPALLCQNRALIAQNTTKPQGEPEYWFG